MSDIFNKVPLPLLIVILILIIIFTILILKNVQIKSLYFLGHHFIMNIIFSLLISFTFGIFIETYELQGNQYIMFYLPALLSIAFFLKNFLVYYDTLNTTCAIDYTIATGEKPKEPQLNRIILLIHSFKNILMIIIIFTLIMFFPSMTKPFYDIFNNDTMLIHYFGIGFWIGCATMISETSIYFNLLTYGCLPVTKINLKTDILLQESSDENEDSELSTENNFK